ncbi:CBU_1576 family Dot/Icm T4SS effector [Coxiella burnetii]
MRPEHKKPIQSVSNENATSNVTVDVEVHESASINIPEFTPTKKEVNEEPQPSTSAGGEEIETIQNKPKSQSINLSESTPTKKRVNEEPRPSTSADGEEIEIIQNTTKSESISLPVSAPKDINEEPQPSTSVSKEKKEVVVNLDVVQDAPLSSTNSSEFIRSYGTINEGAGTSQNAAEKPTEIVLDVSHLIEQLRAALTPSTTRQYDADSYFKIVSILMSLSLSVGPALLSLGLSLQDDNLPSGPTRWVFAVLCGLFSSVQSGMVSHMTFEHYLSQLKFLIHTLKKRELSQNRLEEGIEAPANVNIYKKLLKKSPSFFVYSLYEASKWIALYFASALPTSLAEQVSYLKNSAFKYYLRASTMIVGYTALENFLTTATALLPSLNNKHILNGEKRRFRDAVITILKQNCHDAQDKNTEAAQRLFKLISNQSTAIEPHKILEDLFENSRGNPIFLQDTSSYLQWALTLVFLTVYVGSSSGDYRAAVQDPDNTDAEIIPSILGDITFASLVAQIAAGNLISAFYNRFLIFCRHEWPSLLINSGCTLLTIFTVPGPMAVSVHEKMPFFITYGLTPLGTMLDYTIFSSELSQDIYLRYKFRSGGESYRHQRAVIETFYQHFQEKLEQLSLEEFIQWIKISLEKFPDLFKGYEAYLYKVLPWAKEGNLTPSQILDILNDKPSEAMKTINAAGHLGLKHKSEKLFIAAMAALVSGATFIPENNLFFRIILDHVFPATSITLGLTFNFCLFPKRIPEEKQPLLPIVQNNEENNSPQESNPSCWSKTISFFKYVMLLTVPSLVGAVTKKVAHFALQDIFNNDQVEENSEIIGHAATTATSFVVVYSMKH